MVMVMVMVMVMMVVVVVRSRRLRNFVVVRKGAGLMDVRKPKKEEKERRTANTRYYLYKDWWCAARALTFLPFM